MHENLGKGAKKEGTKRPFQEFIFAIYVVKSCAAC